MVQNSSDTIMPAGVYTISVHHLASCCNTLNKLHGQRKPFGDGASHQHSSRAYHLSFARSFTAWTCFAIKHCCDFTLPVAL